MLSALVFAVLFMSEAAASFAVGLFVSVFFTESVVLDWVELVLLVVFEVQLLEVFVVLFVVVFQVVSKLLGVPVVVPELFAEVVFVVLEVVGGVSEPEEETVVVEVFLGV